MAQHISGGLQIMREHRARPCLVSSDELAPAYSQQLPLVDIFVIKLFSAPCKFADRPTSDKSDEETAYLSPQSMSQPVKPRDIVPNMKTELTKIATSTTSFLQAVSRITHLADATRLLTPKGELMVSLDKWSAAFDRAQAELDGPELLSLTFMRLFYQILRLIVLGALESSPDIEEDIRTECLELQEIAFTIGERVKTYSMPSAFSLVLILL
ncbi:hypothetical protein Golomagni_07774 [Golovinomyces magnicellulatus]|nr:hypothetical protein Golomagni_07774 [Golovinomyces magnicellulatus]